MPSAKFCLKCGKPAEHRMVAGRERAVCAACDEIFYENPLPVAAAVVLNERREVLLVRRRSEPHRGAWCLPMGFAELGETIAEAAQRELREETGIEAEVQRLVDADSFHAPRYGDLLIVTFELIKTGGREQPGDDAEAVRYFPLGRHPDLPFPSNEQALRKCAALHMENWAIQDSFFTLQSTAQRTRLSDPLVDALGQQAGEIAATWLAEVRSSRTTSQYATVDEADLLQRGRSAIERLSRWLEDEAAAEVRTFYRAVGRDRQAEGVPLHEVLSAIALLKKHIWAAARGQVRRERAIDVYRVVELGQRIAVFFDKVMYHTTRGYNEAGRRADESASHC